MAKLQETIVLLVMATGFVGCRAQSGGTALKDADATSGQAGTCSVLDFQTGQSADLSQDNSPFAKLILNAPNVQFQPAGGANPACPQTIHEVLSAFDGMPGSSRQIFMVDETGDQIVNSASDGNHRFVVSQKAGLPNETPADILLAPLEGEPGKLDTKNLEVISFDPSRGVNVFYKFMNGRWNVMGNGAQIDPQKSQNVTAANGQFFCQSCHPTGALNFKELKLPWNDWSGVGGLLNSFTMFFILPNFNAPDPLLNAWLRGDPSLPKEPRLSSAYTLESVISDGNGRLVPLRVSHVLAGDTPGAFPGQSLKTLVREEMCDVDEVNLASTNQMSRVGTRSANPTFPSSFLVADELAKIVQQNVRIQFSADAYKAAIATQTMDGLSGANDTMFALFGPERSFVGDLVGKALIAQGWLTNEALAAILMTDYPNPMFSAERCDLASTIPDIAIGTPVGDSTNGAAAFMNNWIQNLQASTLPGAKGLASRLGQSGQLTAYGSRVHSFSNACSNRAKSDPQGFMADMVKLVQQRREELRQDQHLNRGNQGFPQIIESPDLFPVPGTPAVPGAVHVQEDCTLGGTAPVVE